jgi:hypothetical protein
MKYQTIQHKNVVYLGTLLTLKLEKYNLITSVTEDYGKTEQGHKLS